MPEMHPCPLCKHEFVLRATSEHHLLPASRGGGPEHKVRICNTCHKQIHALYTNKELAQGFDSLAALERSPPMYRYLKWARKRRPNGYLRVRKSNKRGQTN